MNPTVHATCVLVGGSGVLIRGPSRAGKSSLALALIDEAPRHGLAAVLVADDRVHLEAENGALVAHVPPTIAGLIERRGEGVVPIVHVAKGVVRLVVDLVERGSDGAMGFVMLEGISLPFITLTARNGQSAAAVLQALATL